LQYLPAAGPAVAPGIPPGTYCERHRAAVLAHTARPSTPLRSPARRCLPA
jgi:hypothetical protein